MKTCKNVSIFTLQTPDHRNPPLTLHEELKIRNAQHPQLNIAPTFLAATHRVNIQPTPTQSSDLHHLKLFPNKHPPPIPYSGQYAPNFTRLYYARCILIKTYLYTFPIQRVRKQHRVVRLYFIILFCASSHCFALNSFTPQPTDKAKKKSLAHK